MTTPPPDPDDAWTGDAEDASMVPAPTTPDVSNGHHDDPESENPELAGEPSTPSESKPDAEADAASPVREKQIKPNKVYVGGLPEHTRQEDLENCFGKLGGVVNVELKLGYGFVEFDSRQAAEDAVNKYHDGFFMGNKIKVELSHGGGRTAKFTNEPGACFKCGSQGHWARECPHGGAMPPRRYHDGPLNDREHHPRDGRHDHPPRDYRRSPPPPRDYRDFPPPPPRMRDYDDYRRGPPPPLDRYGPPPGRFGPPPPDFYRYGPPPPVPYDRYDRRPPLDHRLPPGYPPPGRRSPPRYRDDYDRPPPPRDYPDYRGPRYHDYPRPGPPDAGPPPRYR